MNDQLFIMLQSKLDTSQKALGSLNAQIDLIGSKLNALNISVNFDDKALKDINSQLSSLIKNANVAKVDVDTSVARKEIGELNTVLEKITETKTNGKTTSIAYDLGGAIGEHKQLVEILGEESKVIEKSSINYKEQTDAIASLNRQKANMLSKVDVLNNKKDLDPKLYQQFRDEVSSLSIETVDYKNKLKDLGTQYQILNRESKNFAPMGNTKLSDQIDNWKIKINSMMEVLKRDKNVDNGAFKKLSTDIKGVSIDSKDAQMEMKKLDAIFQALSRTSIKKAMPETMSDYEKNIRAITHQLNIGTLAIDDYIAKMQKILYKNNGEYAGQFNNRLDSSAQEFAVNNLERAIKKRNDALSETKKINEAIINQEKKQADNYAKLNKDVEMFKRQMSATLNSISTRNEGFVDENAIKVVSKRMEELTADTLDARQEMQALQKEIGLISKNASTQKFEYGQTMGGKLKNNLMSQLEFWVVGDMFNTAQQAVVGTFNAVRELDSAMVGLKKVTDETESTYSKFGKTASKMANNVGAVTNDFIESTTDFSRLGYTLSEAQRLAKDALTYSNVGDMDIASSTQAMVSTLKGFRLEANQSTKVIDIFNQVGNTMSVTSAGIGEALMKSASSLATANNTLEQSVAMIASANAVVQDPESVGNALKTVSMRIRGKTCHHK